MTGVPECDFRLIFCLIASEKSRNFLDKPFEEEELPDELMGAELFIPAIVRLMSPEISSDFLC